MVDPPTQPGLRPGREAATPRPKRFFATASHARGPGGFALLLDGRRAKTPAKNDLLLPTAGVAAAVADEWNAIGEFIDPVAMPLTRIANTAIDGVAARMAAVSAEVKTYLTSDLLAYRAGAPAPLVSAQADAWDPVLDWIRERFRIRFLVQTGITFVAQPPETLAALGEAVEAAVGDGPSAPFRLAALNVMTTLTGSAVLALATLHGRLAADEAWRVAHVDEEFQEAHWGTDDEALERRARRWIEMKAAATIGLLSAG